MVLLSHSRHSSSYGPIYVYRHALHPPPAPKPPPAAVGAVSGSPFDGQGMWIWYVSKSNGGNVASIVAQAHAAGVSTLFIKSSDGSSNYWSQFSPQLVAELHANGLRACAWQYVYGSNPAGEANLGAKAAANGADCLVIDAESEYEGRYSAAQSYIDDLRAKVGPAYPLALASFPYVSYHPALPYSVFLGPNGAQYNAPQMYWKDIGVSVDTVYANTFIHNRVYGRPIFPLGQTYGGVRASDVLRFREEAVDYGSTGLSFWDWQETPASGWSALAAPLAPLTSVVPNASYPELRRGAKGDEVLWLQEHLAGAIPTQEVTGLFGSQTTANTACIPGFARAARERRRRNVDVGRAAGDRARSGRLDGRRPERLSAAEPAASADGPRPGGHLRAGRLRPARFRERHPAFRAGPRLRPAGSACRCRARRRSTSSRGRSPCRSARARAAAW